MHINSYSWTFDNDIKPTITSGSTTVIAYSVLIRRRPLWQRIAAEIVYLFNCRLADVLSVRHFSTRLCFWYEAHVSPDICEVEVIE